MKRLIHLAPGATRLLAIIFCVSKALAIPAFAQDSSDPEAPVYAYSSNEPGGIWNKVSIDFEVPSATLAAGQSGPIPIPNAALASDSNTVGSATNLLISFQWPEISVLDDYIVGLAFPAEFEFTSGLQAAFTDDNSAPDPDLREISITPQTVTLHFRRNFFAPEPGQMSFITLKDVTLPLVAGDYSAVIFIGDTAFNILAGPTFTNELTVVPEAPTSLEPVPGSFEPDIIVIGKPFTFSALAVKGGPGRDSLIYSNSRFELYNQSNLIGVDASAQGAGDTISLLSSEITLPSNMPGQTFGARFIVDVIESIGTHKDTIDFGPQVVLARRLPKIEIVSVAIISPNSPRLNTGQSARVEVVVENSSPLSAIGVSLVATTSGLSSITPGDFPVRNIFVGATEVFEFELVASPLPVNSEEITFNLFSDSGAHAHGSPVSKTIIVERPPQLVFEAEVIGATGGVVEIGQTLTLILNLSNRGESKTSPGKLRVTASGAGIDLGEEYSFSAGDALTLPIGPPTETGNLVITADIIDIPVDRNTGKQAQFSLTSGPRIDYRFFVLEQIARVQARISKTGEYSPGAETNILSIVATNTSRSDSVFLKARELKLNFTGPFGNRIDPADILNLDRTFLFDSSGHSVAFRDVIEDTLVLTFASTILGPQESITLNLRASFLDFPIRDGFRVEIPFSEFTFEVTSGPLAGTVVAPQRSEFSQSARFLFSTSFPGLAGTFTTSENPAKFGCSYWFHIDQGNGYKLEIFDLTGEMVWKEEGVSPGDPTFHVNWNVENLAGRKVRDGVYWVVLTDLTTGETFKLKQAVLK